ncbi:hypothetical protein D3C84_986910 [compost metagenome]
MTAIVGAVQRFEANQAARRLAYRGCLGCGDARQAGLAQTAELPHAQAECRVAGQLNRTVSQAHITRDRQSGARFAEAGRIQAILLQQGLWICPEAVHGVRQAMNEAYR